MIDGKEQIIRDISYRYVIYGMCLYYWVVVEVKIIGCGEKRLMLIDVSS